MAAGFRNGADSNQNGLLKEVCRIAAGNKVKEEKRAKSVQIGQKPKTARLADCF